MTQAQKSLYDLLMRTNKLSQKAGDPYLADPKEAFQKIAEASDDEISQQIVKESREKTLIPRITGTGEEGGQIEVLLWLIYFRNGGMHNWDGTQAPDRWITLRGVLSNLIEQSGDFVKIAQSRETNALAALFNKDLQKDIFGNATATAKGVEFRIEGYNDVGDLRVQTLMLFDAIRAQYTRTKDQSIRLPLKDYATLRGKAGKSKDQLKEFRKEVLEDLALLKNLSWKCKERINGKWVDSGFVGICGGTAAIVNGVIYFNFNNDLIPSLNRLAPADYPKEIWGADPRTNKFQFGRYIAQNYRLNEGKERQNTITVKQLLSVTDNLPSIEDVTKGRHSPKRRIIQPFFRDLDNLESIWYDVIDEHGNEVIDPYELDYPTFEKCSIVIDYSEYPDHEHRVKRNKKRAEKIRAAKKK